MTYLTFTVIEHYHNGSPPDQFGSWFGHDVRPGETIRLRWIDGKPAYEARVFRRDETTLHVHAMDDWQRFCDLWRSIYAHKETYGDPPGYRKAAEFLARG